MATIHDHIPGSNILPFPTGCMTTGAPCAPQTPVPWTPGESYVLLSSTAPLITVSAKLQCVTGCGVISITTPGQSTFDIQSPDPKLHADGGGLLKDAWDFLVGDDVDTLLDSDASWLDRGLAGAGLIPIPVGKLAKLRKLVRVEDKTDDVVDAARAAERARTTKGMKGRTLNPIEVDEFDVFAARARQLGWTENPHRTGSWGTIENGKFRERGRIDVAEDGKPGYRGKTHIHIDGEDNHLDKGTPLPGE